MNVGADSAGVDLRKYEIGRKLRRLRLRKSMGLRELSEHTGLSAGMLSKLERGLLVPTLSTLDRVAKVFSVNLSHFFELEPRPLFEIVRRADRLRFPELVSSTEVSYTFENLNYPVTNPHMHCYFAEFVQHAAARCTPHSHAGFEFLYLLSGALEMVTARQAHRLEPGDAVYFDSSEPHAYRRCGPAETTGIVITTTRPAG